MSQKIMEDLIKEFVRKIKEKLPEWLKEKKQELRETLAEIEEHIWDKAEELSDTGKPTDDTVRLAIAHMGTPQTIAKEYKRRGTPKVYITEELWPLYTKTLTIVCSIILVLYFISVFINVITGNFWEIFNMGGLFMGLFFTFTIVSVIFVALSMEGYLPEDFKSEKERMKEAEYIEKAQEKGIPISPKTGKPMKPMVDVGGEIAGGIIQMVIAFILITQPIPVIFELMHADFRLLLILFGATVFVEGVLDLSRGIVGNHQPGTHQMLHVFLIVVKILAVPLPVILWQRPEIFPIIIFTNPESALVNIGISEEFYDLYRILGALVILGFVLGPLENVYKIAKIEQYKKLL